jgi:hypothetical protein
MREERDYIAMEVTQILGSAITLIKLTPLHERPGFAMCEDMSCRTLH